MNKLERETRMNECWRALEHVAKFVLHGDIKVHAGTLTDHGAGRVINGDRYLAKLRDEIRIAPNLARWRTGTLQIDVLNLGEIYGDEQIRNLSKDLLDIANKMENP